MELNVAKEQARTILPLNLNTTFIWTIRIFRGKPKTGSVYMCCTWLCCSIRSSKRLDKKSLLIEAFLRLGTPDPTCYQQSV